ncbi:MAG: alpha/beta hydrolase fold domain-containing protein [Terriglobia bacterium]
MKKIALFAMPKIVLLIALAALCSPVWAQTQEPVIAWAALAALEYRVVPNIVYQRAGGFEDKLDVIAADDTTTPRPTVIYIHGGGWVEGNKEDALPFLLPYLAKGMDIVNVEYRLASVAVAPAAVEDCRCALRWVYRNAREYGFDLSRLVVSGHSAGGHLSLMTGMLRPEDGFDNECPGEESLKVAAIINFWGITDVEALLQGVPRKTHAQAYAVRWLGSSPYRQELAHRLSPLSYVRAGLPPILTIHGDKDQVVPYEQAVRLHEVLDRAKVANQLLTIPGGIHGRAGREATLKIYETIFSFLGQHGVLPQ